MKRNYFVLEYDKDLVGITALKKGSKSYDLQGTLISSLIAVDIALKRSNMPSNIVKGILFSMNYHEVFNYEQENDSITLYIVTDDNKRDFKFFNDFFDLLGILRFNSDEIKKVIKEDDCYLIYGDKDLAAIAINRLPQDLLYRKDVN